MAEPSTSESHFAIACLISFESSANVAVQPDAHCIPLRRKLDDTNFLFFVFRKPALIDARLITSIPFLQIR
jgi:hypothetical protein